MTQNEDEKREECFSRSIIQIYELIGSQKVYYIPQNNRRWILLKAIIEGKCDVVESINDAPYAINEKLNGFIDEKNCIEEECFALLNLII